MKNAIEARGGITAIIINSPKYGRKETLISTNKLERAQDYVGSWGVSWSPKSKTFSILGNLSVGNGKYKRVQLHRWITEAPDGMFVDHINHDTLNNTNDNLRICTNSENQQNRKGSDSDNKSSGIRGVTWNKRHGKWYSQLRVNGKQIHLGCFEKLADARSAAEGARAKYMPFSVEAAG